MTQQTNGTPDLNYSEEAFKAMYEALESTRDILREIHHYQDDQPVLSPINKALAQARRE